MQLIDPGPLRIAPDTHLVRLGLRAEGSALPTQSHSMVILGDEPVLVDVGPRIAREPWLAQVGSLVDLGDVRWIFLTHEEADHAGNLDVVLEHAPHATVVTSGLTARRIAVTLEVPLRRQRWVVDGERFEMGGRRFRAVRPPVFDAPGTLGVLDDTTGTYWAADAFGVFAPTITDHVGQLDAETWAEGAVRFASWLSPWHHLLAPERWRAELARFRDLAPTSIASAHGPVVPRSHVEAASSLLARLPDRPPTSPPGQDDLDALLLHGAATDPGSEQPRPATALAS